MGFILVPYPMYSEVNSVVNRFGMEEAVTAPRKWFCNLQHKQRNGTKELNSSPISHGKLIYQVMITWMVSDSWQRHIMPRICFCPFYLHHFVIRRVVKSIPLIVFPSVRCKFGSYKENENWNWFRNNFCKEQQLRISLTYALPWVRLREGDQLHRRKHLFLVFVSAPFPHFHFLVSEFQP